MKNCLSLKLNVPGESHILTHDWNKIEQFSEFDTSNGSNDFLTIKNQ